MSDEILTTEDYINANRSPLLQATRINYRSTETPPPLVDISVEDDSDLSEVDGERQKATTIVAAKVAPKPSVGDSFLISLLGPNYPELASQAAKEFIILAPEVPWDDRTPRQTSIDDQMVLDHPRSFHRSSNEGRTLAFEASQKLNVAISKNVAITTTAAITGDLTPPRTDMAQILAETPASVSNAYQRSFTTHHQHLLHSQPLTHQIQDKSFNVKPPPRISLPSIRTQSSGPPSEWSHSRSGSMTTSPELAKYSINSGEHQNDQHLPRMNGSPATTMSSHAPHQRQTLPSLETALSAISTSSNSVYGASPSLTRPSSVQPSQLGPSPSSYPIHSPASAVSPPRLTTNPSFWRTTSRESKTDNISRETSNSTPSEHNSVPPSAGISTPASSAPGLSPAYSGSTPTTNVHNPESHYGDEATTPDAQSQYSDSGFYNGTYSGAGFKCTWPGCTAPPFQTQYLLNSHANVHSNTRPHFCPVHGCPRGPGGQGFKRKNEMIRHGLVHQSPGYVCPFCPDQQHKYPRPDNLQRHVRVHHVDKDRDDPMLREVLAQRPEGGNRGRRRRLGS